MKRKILLLLVSVLISQPFLVSCDALNPPEPTPIVNVNPGAVDLVQVYFSDPDNPQSETFRGGPDVDLAHAIDLARLSVEVAIMHVNLWSIRDALIAAHNRGVNVRVVVESDNLDELEIEELRDAGIPVLGDRREALMHHKFVIIDDREVWTGSMNFTTTGAYKNNNNILRVHSPEIAANYKAEFNEMFVDDLFGDMSRPNTPNPSTMVGVTLVETYFSPEDGTAERILQLISEARESIHFMAFSFTSDSIGYALIEQAGNGVIVSGIFEESQYYSNIGTEFDRLSDAGLFVSLDKNRYNMHHKVMVIDQKIVITGSYNFSKSAETRNDENTLIIFSSDVAGKFIEEFERIYLQANPPPTPTPEPATPEPPTPESTEESNDGS